MTPDYENWSPIEDMPANLADVSITYECGRFVLYLFPASMKPLELADRIIRVQFGSVLAHAVYDDMVFSLSDIRYGIVGIPSFIVRNWDWPGSHSLYESTGYKNVTLYRFGSLSAIVDVLAAGPVRAEWVNKANQSTDPTLASGTPLAEPESRHP
jgi:hypothetical protein